MKYSSFKHPNLFLLALLATMSAGCARSADEKAVDVGESTAPVTATIQTESTAPTAVPTPTASPVQATISLPPLKLPSPPVLRTQSTLQIAQAKAKLAKYPTSAGWRRLAELHIAAGQFAEAAKAYRQEAAIYRAKGLTDAASIQEAKAARYESEIRLSVVRKPTENELKVLWTRARLEPKTGAYIGAFIDRDETLRRTLRGENWQTHRYPSEWAEVIGKKHASVFTYVQYGRGFPRRWLEMCKREQVIPQIAWEPKSLHDVQDNKFLRDVAKYLKRLDWPVFIRFAGEMNGFWTPYHGNPILYRQKFRLVHKVLTSTAPKVATIWAVNAVPVENIPNYYPGDDGCDWVGFNLYSVPFYDNNRSRPAFGDDPLTLFEPIYKRYAAKKPIAIGEYAASHQAAVDRVVRNDFAIEKMSQLYQSLPARFPRIKLVSWYSSNNLKHAKPGRQLNNYNLTQQEPILNAYRKLIAPEYFLSEPERGDEVVPLPLRLREGANLPRQFRINLWTKSYSKRAKLFLALGDRLLFSTNGSGAHEQTINIPQSISPGRRVLSLYLYDEHNRFIAVQRVNVVLAAS